MITRLSALFLTFLLAGTHWVASAQQHDPASVQQPDLREGDEWDFDHLDLWQGGLIDANREQILEVNGSEALLLQRWIKPGGEQRNVRRIRLETATLTERNNRPENFYFLPFPLKPGQSWKFEFPNKDPRRATNSVERWGKVIGWEDVSVPAGSFRALRIDISERRMWQAGDGVFPNYEYRTFWYVPEVKRFVRYEREIRDGANKRWSYEGFVLTRFSVH